ncbi:hypothetical protein C0991_002760 [Blastosporella zonata]|nr:hypothetical protein C0991_002760 [Blastosporella zonata]
MTSPPPSPKPSLRQRLWSTKKSSNLASPNDEQVPVLDVEPLSVTTDDIDREQSSVNATLTPRRVPFYRRMTSSKTSELTGRSSRSNSHSPSQRPSLFSRVVHRVVPCVTPDPHQDIDLDHQTSKDDDTPPAEMHQVQIPPSDILLPLSIPPTPSHPPPSPTDSEIIVTPPPSAQLLPEDETDGLTSGAVQPPGSTGTTPPSSPAHTAADGNESDATNFTDDDPDVPMHDDNEEALIRKGGSGIPVGPDGRKKPLLPPILPEHAGRKCLVLDLDETLVHSSFKAVQQADFIVPVEIEYHWHHFHVLKRPGVDDFLKKMGEIYEVVIFTASLSKYADPVLDKLDTHRVVAHRLFRESCFSHKGNYVKDLSQLGRPIAHTIILDNSPASYIFHPHNAVPVSSWFNDPHDAELTDLVPFLRDLSGEAVGDVRGILDGAR